MNTIAFRLPWGDHLFSLDPATLITNGQIPDLSDFLVASVAPPVQTAVLLCSLFLDRATDGYTLLTELSSLFLQGFEE